MNAWYPGRNSRQRELEETMEQLRRILIQMLEEDISLCDDDVLRVSRHLDAVIVEYYQEMP